MAGLLVLVQPSAAAPARALPAFAIDHRWFGDSERPDGGYAITDLAADAAAFLDAVAVDRATVGGHSLGSFIARRVAVAFPERVGRLVLIGSGASPLNPVTREVQASLRDLAEPVPTTFVREFQASTAHVPLPVAFFEGIVAESQKAPARVWRGVFDGLLAFDDTAVARADRGADPRLFGVTGTSCSPGRTRTASRRRSPTRGSGSIRTRGTARTGSAPSRSSPISTPSCGRPSRGARIRAGRPADPRSDQPFTAPAVSPAAYWSTKNE